MDCFDFGDPRDGETGGELHLMDDDGSRVDGAVGAAGGGKTELVRGDFVEIERVREEFPSFLAGDWEELLLDDVFHEPVFTGLGGRRELPFFAVEKRGKFGGFADFQ